MDGALALLAQSGPFLAKGLAYTLALALFGMGAGLVLGFGPGPDAAVGEPGPAPCPPRPMSRRCVARPLLVQLFLIYYGLPQLGLELSPLVAAGIGFSLNMAAYAAEILRSSIAAIDRGQWEAAEVLGLSRRRTLRLVILPQAARTAVAPLSNSFISMIKDTSLAATIQVPELFRQAQLITARTFQIFTMYLAVAAIYWVACAVLAQVQHRLERRAAWGRTQ
ncbi:MAG: ABC transporter permease subunit [Caulobacteraceae bacterium]